jgi:hypothetical protein
VSEARAAGMESQDGGWLARLSICLPLVFLIGVPTILITRGIFLYYHPENFVGSSPTISETASLPPASLFFLTAMMLVVACIFVSWPLNAFRNQARLNILAAQGVPVVGPTILQWTACILGLLAGFCLGVIAIYNLEDAHDIHLMGSWVFYLSQAISITLDILFVLWVRRLTASPGRGDGLMSRVAVAVAIFLGSWFFLYMYLSKDYAAPEHRYAIQLIYVGAEYFVATFFLAYPMTAYAEMRRHFRELTGTGRQD